MEKIEAFFEGAWIVPVFIISTLVFVLAMELALRLTNRLPNGRDAAFGRVARKRRGLALDRGSSCSSNRPIRFMTGPRGNGKTVLLNWFKRACEDRELDAVALTPDEVPSRAALAAALSPRTWTSKLRPRKVGVAAVGSVEWATSAAEAPDDLARKLRARCRRKAVAALLDEAHTLDPEVGRTLLNAGQRVRVEAAVPAGAGRHAGAARASRDDECVLLESSGAGTAGHRPPERSRRPGCSGRAAGGARGGRRPRRPRHGSRRQPALPVLHPALGDALWERLLATGADRLTPVHVAEVRPDVAAWMTDYCQERYRELEAGGLLPRGRGAGARLPGPGADATASDHDFDTALAATGADAAARLAAREALHRLGYVWRPPGQLPPVTWSAGISSLMTHVLDHAKLPEPARVHGK